MAVGSLMISLLLRILHAVTYLALGALYGWYVGRRQIRAIPVEDAPSAEPLVAEMVALGSEQAENLLNQLYGLTADVAQGVGEHSLNVAAIGRDLTALAQEGDGKSSAPVIKAIASLLQANSRLEEQLASASQKMQEQAKEIECKLADALTDSLTGIPNRRAFNQELARRFPEYHRNGTPLSLIMIDVDHFKKFNDTHGHQAGDEVLRGVARVLKEAVREMDLPTRFGGEEFAIVLPVTSLDVAGQVAERVRLAIEKASFKFEGVELRVTASIGVAQFITDDNEAGLIKRADTALYASKSAGRNCAHYHDGVASHRIVADETNAKIHPAGGSETDTQQFSGDAHSPAAREQFFREVERRLSRGTDDDARLAILMVELDGLNQANEKGLQKAVLNCLRQTVQANVGESDYLAVFNRNSFAVLLQDKDSAAAVEVADLLHSRFAKSCAEFVVDGQKRFTTSYGIADGHGEDAWSSIVNRAEQALTASKQHGGDCIHFHTDKTRQPMLADLQTLSAQ